MKGGDHDSMDTWQYPWENQRRPLREVTFNPGFRGGRPQVPEYHKTRVHKADTLLSFDCHILPKESKSFLLLSHTHTN